MASQTSKEVKARYRERHREKIRTWNREYAERKRREAGVPAQDSPESSENRRRAHKPKFGSDHPNWKGDEVGYFALHAWLDRNKERTGMCSECGTKPRPLRRRTVATEWANISGEYKRDLADYVELCVPCHRRRDAKGLEHGTLTGYGYYGCRCDECRRVANAYSREWKRARRGV